jgi:hypothetical protein
LRCATHLHRKSAEYRSHFKRKIRAYQALHSGRRCSPGTAPISCRRCSQTRLGLVRILARNHSSRHPAIGGCRCKCVAPDTSRFSLGSLKKAILSRNSSPIAKTQEICGYSAWLHEHKETLLSSRSLPSNMQARPGQFS